MYIIIELHGGPEYAHILINEDGSNMVFNSIEDAELEAKNCQEPVIIDFN